MNWSRPPGRENARELVEDGCPGPDVTEHEVAEDEVEPVGVGEGERLRQVRPVERHVRLVAEAVAGRRERPLAGVGADGTCAAVPERVEWSPRPQPATGTRSPSRSGSRSWAAGHA